MNYSGDKTFDRVLNLTVSITFLLFTQARYQKRAPYGKFGGNQKNVINLDPRLGWWLMELPATVSFLINYYLGEKRKKEKEEKDASNRAVGPKGVITRILFLVWCMHYFNRGWYFPLTIRVAEGSKASFALFNAAIGAIFLTAHGYLNARLFTEFGEHLTDSWLKDPRFIFGLILQQFGFWTIIQSESIMRNLRPANEIITAANRYKIPTGGLYEYITNPAYFGEIVAWTGFLVMTWSPTFLPVLFITLGNLVPRAFEQHKWYLKKFPNYPKNRKVLIPLLL